MSSFSSWDGLCEPGEACVKCGGKPSSTLAHASTRGFADKGKQKVKGEP
jgi:hypothetical protein